MDIYIRLYKFVIDIHIFKINDKTQNKQKIGFTKE